MSELKYVKLIFISVILHEKHAKLFVSQSKKFKFYMHFKVLKVTRKYVGYLQQRHETLHNLIRFFMSCKKKT